MRGTFGVALVSLAVTAGSAWAQGHPMYVVHQEYVKPSMVQQYEGTQKEFVAMITKNKAAMPHFSFAALVSDDFVYTYVAPVPNYAGMDAITQDFGALAQKEGAGFADLMKRGGAPTELVRESVVSFWPELSYSPAAPRLRFEDARYFHYDIYHVMPGRDGDAEALAREFVALFKSKNLPNGYRLFKAEMGPELPGMVVEVAAKDPADYYTQQVADRTALGAEGQALFAKAFALTRRFETRSAWLRPDLSVMPAK
jgi:hypothetical protein